MEKLQKIDGLKIIGPLDPKARTGLVSFYFDDIHAHDIASVLNSVGVAVRSGHHCVMPYHVAHGIVASVRASYYVYNDTADLDLLLQGIEKAVKVFKK